MRTTDVRTRPWTGPDPERSAATRFTRLPAGNPAGPATLSILLHVALVLILVRQLELVPDPNPGSDSQQTELVMVSDWARDRADPSAAPATAAVREVVRLAAGSEPPAGIQLAHLEPPAVHELVSTTIDRVEVDEPTTEPEQLDAGEFDLGAAAAIPQPLATAAATQQPLATAAAIPQREEPASIDTTLAVHKIPIGPALQTDLVRRVVKLAHAAAEKGRTELSWQQDGQPYRAVLTHDPGADDMDLERVLVSISTQGRDGASLRTRLTLKRIAYSHFAQVIDEWDPNVELHDDEIIGRFHSNSTFLVSSDPRVAPRISGRASSTAGNVQQVVVAGELRRYKGSFEGGFEGGAARIDLPNRVPRPRLQTLDPAAHVRKFDYDVHVTFHDDGSYTWHAPGADVTVVERYPLDHPVYLIGAPRTMLFVKGTVRGTVLVYAYGFITIEGNLRYADDPRTSPEADDYLALVSDQYVSVARPELTGPGDLQIDAAIFARRAFMVRNIMTPRAGTLAIYGSLTAGTMSATEPRYATRVEFDPRLGSVRLPNFPSTNRFELDRWNAEWVELEDDVSSPGCPLPAGGAPQDGCRAGTKVVDN